MAAVEAELVLSVEQALAQIDALGQLIDEVTGNVQVDVGVTADTAEAQADIGGLDAEPVDVEVTADTAEATAEIEAIPEPDPIDIEVTATGADEATASIDGLGDSLTAAQSAAGALGSALGAGGLGAALGVSLSAFADTDKVAAIAQQRIESLGATAVTSAGDMQALATSLQSQTGISDEAIVSAQSLLLTFGNLSSTTVTTKENFDRATRAIFDISTVQGDAQGNAIALGKALEDPVAGLGRLSRAGISFTDEQKALIQSLVDTGQVAEAQGVILDEIEDKYGGLAAAAGGSLAGGIDRAGQSLNDFEEDVGQALAVVAGPALDGFSDLLEAFQRLPEPVQRGVAAFVAISVAGGAAVFAINAIKVALPQLTAAFAAGGGALATAAPVLLALAAAAGVAAGLISIFSDDTDSAVQSTEELAAASHKLAAAYQGGGGIVNAVTQGLLEQTAAGGDLADTLAALGLTEREYAELLASGTGISDEAVVAAVGLGDAYDDANSALQDSRDALSQQAEAAIEAALANGQLTDEQVAQAEAQALQDQGLTDSGREFLNYVEVLGLLPAAAFQTAQAIQAITDSARDQIPSLGDAISNVEDNLNNFGQTIDSATDAQLVIDNLADMLAAFTDFNDNLAVISAQISPDIAAQLAALGPDVAGGFAQALADTPEAFAQQLAFLSIAAENEGVELGDLLAAGVGGAVDSAGEEAANKSGEFGAAMTDLGSSAADDFKEGVDRVGGFADDAARSAVSAVKSKETAAATAGFGFGVGFAEGAGDGADGMVRAGLDRAQRAVGAVKGVAKAARQAGFTVGDALAQGIAEGVDAGAPFVAAAARRAVDQAVRAANSEAGVHSPSTVMAELGEQMVAGLALGLADGASVIAAAEALTAGAVPGNTFSDSSTTIIQVDARGATDPQAVGDAVAERLAAHNRVREIKLGMRAKVPA